MIENTERHNLKVHTMCIIGVSKGELRVNWAEAVSEEPLTENFPKLMKNTKSLS